MVLLERIELSTSPLPRECSTSELQQPAAVSAVLANIAKNASAIWTLSTACCRQCFMAQDKADQAGNLSPKEKAAAERAERLRKQLRDNLQKRKAQGRARKSAAKTNEA